MLFTGIVLGNIEWLCTILYTATTDFTPYENTYKACVVFVLLPLLMYLFIYICYFASHQGIETDRQRTRLLLFSLPFSVVLQFKVFTGVDRFHKWYIAKYKLEEETFNIY